MAEPPTTSFQPLRSVAADSGASSTICRMAGTQCEKVTRSVAMSFSRAAGW